MRGLFAEDGAQSLAVIQESESIFHCKTGDLCFALFLLQRPEALQFTLINSTVLPFAALQFVFDLMRERFHIGSEMGGVSRDLSQCRRFFSIPIGTYLLPLVVG